MSSESIAYIYASIDDIRSTIRSSDSKVSYLLVVLFLPLTKLGSIYGTISSLFGATECIAGLLLMLTVVLWSTSWGLAFWMAFRTLLIVNSPVDRISGGESVESTFFPSSLFKQSFTNCLGIRTEGQKSSSSLQDHFDKFPNDEDSIRKELVFEQMKTMYIASVKGRRCTTAYWFSLIWITLGGILWFLELAVVK
ncbi:MAG: hypothetical protein ACSHYA_12995 [Opitutaceae bacterium]